MSSRCIQIRIPGKDLMWPVEPLYSGTNNRHLGTMTVRLHKQYKEPRMEEEPPIAPGFKGQTAEPRTEQREPLNSPAILLLISGFF